MVLKKAKGSICTGATLRAPVTFSKQPPLLNCFDNHRGTHLVDSDSSGIVIEGSTNSEVQYSLNKKGRWNIPDMLKEAIEQEVFCGEDYKISLLEKHDINMGRNDRGSCISLYQCNGPKSTITKKIPKGTSYLNGKSILKELDLPKKPNSRRRRHRQHIEITDEEDIDVPKVQFEVVYPKPADRMVAEKCYRWKVTKKSTCRKELMQDMLFYEVNADGDDDFSNNEDSDVDSSDTSLKGITFSLADAVKIPNKGMKKSKRKSSNSGSSLIQEKGYNVIKIDKPQSARKKSKANKAAVKTQPTHFSPEPVTVQIEPESMSAVYLEDKYGINYRELSVMPRKFIIDITRSVHATIKPWDVLIEVYVVFQHLRDNQYNVHIDGSFSLESLAIETLCPMENYTIAEVMRRTMMFIEMLPDASRSFQKLETGPNTICVQRPDIVASAIGYEMVSQKANIECDAVSTGDSEIFVDDFDKLCMVCMASCIDGMVLKECRHWFCQQCWKEYIKESVLQGNGAIKCIEYKCNIKVDPMSVLAICDYHTYTIYKKLWEARIVASDTCTRKCPQGNCDRVLILNRNPGVESNVPMRCMCGNRFCSGCLESSHWPASCRMAEAYVTRMKNDGFSALTDHKQLYVAKVKRCPFCKMEFEKTSGCDYIYCRCRNAFCWKCCKPYNEFHSTGRCSTDVQKMREVEFLQFEGSGKEAYRRAIQHRTAQRSCSILHLRKQLKKYLPKTLRECPTRCVATYYVQLHQVAEYICVVSMYNSSRNKANVPSFKDNIFLIICQLDMVFEMLGKENAKKIMDALDKLIVQAKEWLRSSVKY